MTSSHHSVPESPGTTSWRCIIQVEYKWLIVLIGNWPITVPVPRPCSSCLGTAISRSKASASTGADARKGLLVSPSPLGLHTHPKGGVPFWRPRGQGCSLRDSSSPPPWRNSRYHDAHISWMKHSCKAGCPHISRLEMLTSPSTARQTRSFSFRLPTSFLPLSLLPHVGAGHCLLMLAQH